MSEDGVVFQAPFPFPLANLSIEEKVFSPRYYFHLGFYMKRIPEYFFPFSGAPGDLNGPRMRVEISFLQL